MSEPVLWAAEELCLAIGRQTLYDNAEFFINAGERVGLIGRNGSGKSTLLRLITGEELPGSGNLTRARNLRVAVLPQDFEIDNGRSIADNVRDGLAWFLELQKKFETVSVNSPEHAEIDHLLMLHDGWNLDTKVEQVLAKLGLSDPQRPCDKLSGGEKRRVALARAIISEPDLLLLDEPTNHLDVAAVEWIEKFLAEYRGSCLFVTHDRYFLDRIATRIVELSHGKLYSYQGSYSDFLAAKAERKLNEDILDAKRRSFLRREVEWVRRSPKARLKRNLGRMKRYDEIAAQSGPVRDSDMELLIPTAYRLGNKTVDLKGVEQKFGDRVIIDHLDFEFEPRSRIGIVGPNGAGKSTLLRIITQQMQPTKGEVSIASTVEFNYIDQSRVALDPEKSVADEISEGVETIQLGAEKISVWGYLKRFLFEDERINTKVKYLSGGEKARLALAKILKQGGNFLILDEPTNDLDLSSLRLLEEALAAYLGCVIVVSHDRYFLNRVCTGILAFEAGGKVVYNPGDYDYYLEKRREREAAALAAEPVRTVKPQPAVPPPAPRERRKLSYKEQRELDGMEEAIAAAEEKVSEIENCFSDPDFFNKYGSRTADLQRQLDDAKTECARLYERWDELESKRAALEGN